MHRRVGAAALAGLAVLLSGFAEPVEEGGHISTSSPEFESSRDQVLDALKRDGFTRGLLSGGLGAASSDQVKAASIRVKQGAVIPGVSVGKAETPYDVIIQPGHYGRKTGATGASGALVAEQQMVAYLVGSVARRLRSLGYNVIVVPADGVVARKAQVFLAVHAEGSVTPCTAGPSLAYKAGTSPYAMHAIGLGLSRAMGYDYKLFRADGYTANSARYYMYNRVDSDKLTGLLEIGEITCPKYESAMLVNADRIATNLASSLDYILKLQ